MTNDKSPEQAAEEWATLETCRTNSFGVWPHLSQAWGVLAFREGCKRGFLAGDSNGYQRGKAEEGQRIWEAVKKSQTIAEFFELQKLAGGVRMSELQQIIFGGGE